jgi:surfactin synthase thioesterase subunit
MIEEMTKLWMQGFISVMILAGGSFVLLQEKLEAPYKAAVGTAMGGVVAWWFPSPLRKTWNKEAVERYITGEDPPPEPHDNPLAPPPSPHHED